MAGALKVSSIDAPATASTSLRVDGGAEGSCVTCVDVDPSGAATPDGGVASAPQLAKRKVAEARRGTARRHEVTRSGYRRSRAFEVAGVGDVEFGPHGLLHEAAHLVETLVERP